MDMANAGDELHHFGWNTCRSALCPDAPHPHIERRYLVRALEPTRTYNTVRPNQAPLGYVIPLIFIRRRPKFKRETQTCQ